MRGLILLALVTQLGCWQKRVKLLDPEEFDHYYALRVFMDEAERKTYLKGETRDARDGYLKELDLWDRFYQYEPHIRDRIIGGEVQTGWTREMVYMAWGAPYDRRKQPGRQAERSELLIYRFEGHSDGSILVWEPNSKTAYKATRLFVRELILDDDHVAEMRDKDSHW